MSHHSYSRCWLHLIWSTYERQKVLSVDARKALCKYLFEYSKERKIFMRANFVNSDHVHTLVDLPTNMCMEELVKLLKGSLSHWINAERLVEGKFAWGRGFGAFSISHSHVGKVVSYIANQEEHHRTKTFAEEHEAFLKVYGFMHRTES